MRTLKIGVLFDILGVICLAVGSFIGLGTSMALGLNDFGMPAVAFALSATILFIAIGARYVIRPRQVGWLGRTGATCLLAVGLSSWHLNLYSLHPYVFGIPGRIGESLFQHTIRVGMTRDQVVQLEHVTGGTGDADSVRFANFESACIVRGDELRVSFDSTQRVGDWQVIQWHVGC